MKNPFTFKDWFNSLFKDKNLRRYVSGSNNDWMIDRNDNDGVMYADRYKMLKVDDIKKCDECVGLFFKEDIYKKSTIKVGKDLSETITGNFYCKRCLVEKNKTQS